MRKPVVRALSPVLLAALLAGCAQPAEDCPPEDRIAAYTDADGDGFGMIPVGEVCGLEPGLVDNFLDCNDQSAEALPGGTEVCDGLDNNCNSQVDEGFEEQTWYPDADGDGFGDASAPFPTCNPPGDGWSLDPRDCDDTNEDVSPDGFEVCGNGLDDDCDTNVDNAVEICDDGIDNTCDGLADCDDPACAGTGDCLVECVDDLIPVPVPATVTNDTTGLPDDWFPTCGSGYAADFAYQFTAPVAGTYVFDTSGSGFDTVLAIFDDCAGKIELTCNDDFAGLQSQVDLTLGAGEVVIVVVDGYSSSSSGPFTLNVVLR